MTNAARKRSDYPPMLQSYLEYKDRYPDCLLFFQVGDFYELFFDDAVTVAQTLNITLTSRDRKQPNPVPMCGVPLPVVDNYIDRLLDAGFSAAVVSQVESAQAGKGMVRRELERIVTPAVRLLGNNETDSDGLLAAMYWVGGEAALAFSDAQSGIVRVREGLPLAACRAELQRWGVSEFVIPDTIEGQRIDRRKAWVRELERTLGRGALKFRGSSYVEGGSRQNWAAIPGFSGLSEHARSAAKLLVSYLDEITVSATLPIREITPQSDRGIAVIDSTTRRTLELVTNARTGREEGSLFHFFCRTKTQAGRRLLRQRLLNPLSDKHGIETRLREVRFFFRQPALCEELRSILGRTTDIERIMTRVELGVVLPRELAALRDTLRELPNIASELASAAAEGDEALKNIVDRLPKHLSMLDHLEEALQESPAATILEGNIVKDGYSSELDRLRHLRQHGREWLAEFESREKKSTGISSLKVKFNNVLGYFIEVTKANSDKVPEDYERRQMTTSAERFTTRELKDHEAELVGAEAKQFSLERELFDELRKALLPDVDAVRSTAGALAELDVALCLAEVALKENYVEPAVSDGVELNIEGGRHPVLADMLKGEFVPNSVHFDSSTRTLIITGPNMGGKSTYLRQIGLITILAQIGSFVPAASATVGIVDRFFARIGASDDLAEGDSTFMVEMREAANIVRAATKRSLVLIDEIGRGTATTDGFAIAQAILEWVVTKTKCRTLFATHFHGLTKLAERFPSVKNVSVGSVERENKVLFTHEIRSGPADKSYGIEVAKLAGLPDDLIHRGESILAERLAQTRTAKESGAGEQLSFLSPPQSKLEIPKDYESFRKVAQEILSLHLSSIRPLDALLILDQLQKSLQEDGCEVGSHIEGKND